MLEVQTFYKTHNVGKCTQELRGFQKHATVDKQKCEQVGAKWNALFLSHFDAFA